MTRGRNGPSHGSPATRFPNGTAGGKHELVTLYRDCMKQPRMPRGMRKLLIVGKARKKAACPREGLTPWRQGFRRGVQKED